MAATCTYSALPSVLRDQVFPPNANGALEDVLIVATPSDGSAPEIVAVAYSENTAQLIVSALNGGTQ